MQILISSKPSRTSSLVKAMPSMPEVFTVWRTSTASNQPQRRGRPVTVPNSWPRSPSNWPTESVSSLGKGPPPTRVVYALAMPSTYCAALGPRPEPVGALPATVFDEVT